MPADILLYALIAAGLIFWLKSIIGTRDEDEDIGGRPLNDDEKDPFVSLADKLKKSEDSNVVPLSNQIGQGFVLPMNTRIDSKTTENHLMKLTKDHDNFDFDHFISGVEYAFPMIIEAFAKGDKDVLKDLLADPVYQAFEGAIDDRESRGETVETEVKSIEKVDVLEAHEKDGWAFITVRFTARETCLIKDSEGEIISGDPERTTQMVDVWVFGKDLSSDGPEWFLCETRDDAEEEHKTPMPDAGDTSKE
jgi:predicted lipid-binding transport protein (Tim44 family)